VKSIWPILVIFLAVGAGTWLLSTRSSAPKDGAAGAVLKKSGSEASTFHEPSLAPPAHEKAFLEEQLKTKPNHPPILVRLGEVERSMGELADARKHLEQALQVDSSLVEARLELSMVCYQLKDEREAERQNLLVLKQDPKQPDALYNLGAIEANRGQFPQAREYWQKVVQYAPDSASGKNAAVALTKLPANPRP
jgi:tetratricopeptide (TPR) repeat protein